MYPFQARIPLDYIKELVSEVRSGEFNLGSNLMLVGAISGEVGALLTQGFGGIGFFAQPQCNSLEECCAQLDEMLVMAQHASVATANGDETKFDPTPWIPVILKLIELWLPKRG